MLVATLVIGGLAISIAVNRWIPSPEALPGIALESHALLVAERAVAFFSIWLLMLIVVAQALKGRLPSEISGRGVRYADGPATRAFTDRADTGLIDLQVEMTSLRRDLAEIQEFVVDLKSGS